MELVLAIGAVGSLFVIALAMLVKNVLYVCQPNEVLIFSGRKRATGQGEVGYRIVKGGRSLRVPLFETVDRMDLTNMIVEVVVKSAYSKGGIPLTVQGVANLKVPGDEPLLHNTLERFLGKARDEIMQIAQQTLEGNLRGVLATLTPEEVNQDKERFAQRLTEEAEHDLSRLGLVLDTLKIQNVSDDVGYLDSIGRMRGAEIRRDAIIAEATAQAEAAEVKWKNSMEGEVSKLNASIEVSKKENDRRIADARTRREAMIAEERAKVQAAIAQAKAEVQMQQARIEQVRLQLTADVIQPAEAQRRNAEEIAKGNASKIIEQGKATAGVLSNLAKTYRSSGESARDVLLMQKLVPLLTQVSSTLGELRVDRLTVIGKPQPGTVARGTDDGRPLAAKLVDATEQIRAATGIDVPALIKDRFGAGAKTLQDMTAEAELEPPHR